MATVNPVSVLIAAVRTLFGNPISPVTKHVWPIDHPVAAAWIYSVVLVVIGLVIAQRRYRGPHHRLIRTRPYQSGRARTGTPATHIAPGQPQRARFEHSQFRNRARPHCSTLGRSVEWPVTTTEVVALDRVGGQVEGPVVGRDCLVVAADRCSRSARAA